MRSPLRWVGGKSKRAKKIVSMFPKDYTTYVEVFGGGASVLFTKQPSRIEILNDFDKELINFWKQVKENHTKIIKSFEYTLISRQIFDEYSDKFKNDYFLDDIYRAHAFYYINRITHSGDMKYPKFNKDKKETKRLNLERIETMLNETYERLINVAIENLDFREILAGYDTENTFFYLDPPYRAKKKYILDFNDKDYFDLAKMCKTIKGRFLLTINDDEYIRSLFPDTYFFISDNYFTQHVNQDKKQEPELIISNYQIPIDNG